MRRDATRYWDLRRQLLKTSLSGMVAFNALVYLGLHSTTASNAQLLNSTIPVLVVIVGTLLSGQGLSRHQLGGLSLSCIGVLTIILHGDIDRLRSLQFSLGDVIVFAAMVSFSLYTVWLREFPADIDRLGLLGAQFSIAAAVFAPSVVGEFIAGYRATWDFGSVSAMMYVGMAAGFLANLLYMLGIARIGPIRAGLCIHLVPLYGVIISAILLGEALHVYHAVGMAMIIAGLSLSQIANPDSANRESYTNA